MDTIDVCGSCGATVVWAPNDTGEPRPFDAVDPSSGTVRIANGVAIAGAVGSGHFVAHACAQGKR